MKVAKPCCGSCWHFLNKELKNRCLVVNCRSDICEKYSPWQETEIPVEQSRADKAELVDFVSSIFYGYITEYQDAVDRARPLLKKHGGIIRRGTE